ncbi:class II aldolase/adducin family protein [Jeotgalibacillus marinus]|uniref:Class II aldolase/adducin family protein n=1 Tax=Jeotgalibacillus marinus TaxID=86667 RepID=A0ABV3Q132_9BACL
MFIDEEIQKNFITISKFAGERYDLIQAGGGNSSAKLEEGKMLIKASGHLLSDVGVNNGYVLVDIEEVLAIFEDSSIIREKNKRKREDQAAVLMKKSIVQSDGRNRPSIETFLHAILYKYTLHTHPIAVNMLTCKNGWEEQLKDLFPKALFVQYKTPGIDLALELRKECAIYQKQIGRLPKIIFLQNHGLIISSDDPIEIFTLTNKVIFVIENALGVDLKRYKLTNELTTIMSELGNNQVISYLSEDSYLTKKLLLGNRSLLNQLPLCPDTLVYCGYRAVEVVDDIEVHKIEEYYDMYRQFPKVVVYKGCLFFVSNTIKKAKEAEEVFKGHIMTLEHMVGQGDSLPLNELRYLDNWEAEKFRQGV